jgi:DMSO/TMAO reductase YedYZ molybdopterin-dependent catalytic subunit/thiosulfate reductase cytochrome b subunit
MHILLATLGFPLWLRITHYVNIIFMGLLIRSGIQIIGAHPRFYWNNGSKPDSNWLRFTRMKIPKDKLWTSMDEEVPVSSLIAQPGGDNLGLGRIWHFFSIIFWVLNGLIYVVLLFATGEWSRLIPTSWDIVPHAFQTFLTYITLHVPPKSDFHPYDPLQQLTYAAVVFLLGPFLIVTGAAQSPAIEAQFPWYVRLFGGRQPARSLHLLGLFAFTLFIILHVALVLVVYFQDNIKNMVLGSEQTDFTTALIIAVVALALVVLLYIATSWYSLRNKQRTRVALDTLVNPTKRLLLHKDISKQHYKESDISPYFWVNGAPPVEEEFKRLAENGFRDWRLEVKGMVVNPLSLSLNDLQVMPKQTQITLHNCIQGWSGIAEWGGVSVTEILESCGVDPEAKYLIFTSYQHGAQSYHRGNEESKEAVFYEVLDMEVARHPQTILAYEMNGKPLPLEHGAPLRLRAETQLGYKMVKYLRSIELVSDYSHIGRGQGGYREDYQYYDKYAEA